MRSLSCCKAGRETCSFSLYHPIIQSTSRGQDHRKILSLMHQPYQQIHDQVDLEMHEIVNNMKINSYTFRVLDYINF